MYLPHVDFIGPDVAPAAAIAVFYNSKGRISAAKALNSVRFEEDASSLSDIPQSLRPNFTASLLSSNDAVTRPASSGGLSTSLKTC
jgi:hypothetical protein